MLRLFLVHKDGAIVEREKPRTMKAATKAGIVRDRGVHRDCWVWAAQVGDIPRLIKQARIWVWWGQRTAFAS